MVKAKKKRKVLIVLLIVLLVLAAASAGAWLYDARHADIELRGEKDIVIEYGSSYIDSGAEAFSTGRLFGRWDTPLGVYAYLPKDIS